MMSAFPEIMVSLTIQCTFVLLLTHFLVRHAGNSIAADRLWSCGHLMILLLCLAGVLLPHPRLFRGESLLLLCHKATMLPNSQAFWTIIFRTWISVAFVLLVNLLRSLVQISLMLRNAAQVAIPWPADAAADGASPAGGSALSLALPADALGARKVRILTANSCLSPFCWQLHQPAIVLPRPITRFPDEELSAVVRHELAHLQLRHPLMLFLQRLVEIGFWFHPLVWWASRAAATQRELAADRIANRSAAEVAAFLRCLLRLSVPALPASPVLPIGLTLFTRDPSTLTQRVEQLLAIDWTLCGRSAAPAETSRLPGRKLLLVMVSMFVTAIWIPLNARATGRTFFSPWPSSTATLLQEIGISVRDYELDSHRVSEQFHAED